MNFTPLYETDKMTLGILEILADDFCHNKTNTMTDNLTIL